MYIYIFASIPVRVYSYIRLWIRSSIHSSVHPSIHPCIHSFHRWIIHAVSQSVGRSVSQSVSQSVGQAGRQAGKGRQAVFISSSNRTVVSHTYMHTWHTYTCYEIQATAEDAKPGCQNTCSPESPGTMRPKFHNPPPLRRGMP